MTSSSIQWCQNSDLTYRKTENSSQTSDRCLQELNLLCCSVDSFPHCKKKIHSIGRLWLVNPRQLHLARAVRAALTDHHCLSQVQSVIRPGGADSWSPCWFRLNILKWIQKWQGSSSSFGEIYRYVFVRYMSVQKCMFYTRRTGRTAACSELGSVWRDMRVPVCLSGCFCTYHIWAWISSEHP